MVEFTVSMIMINTYNRDVAHILGFELGFYHIGLLMAMVFRKG